MTFDDIIRRVKDTDKWYRLDRAMHLHTQATVDHSTRLVCGSEHIVKIIRRHISSVFNSYSLSLSFFPFYFANWMLCIVDCLIGRVGIVTLLLLWGHGFYSRHFHIIVIIIITIIISRSFYGVNIIRPHIYFLRFYFANWMLYIVDCLIGRKVIVILLSPIS